MKKIMLIVGVLFFILLNLSFFELNENKLNFEMTSSLIGLTINGNPTTTFPTKESGFVVDSIFCDKGANGVWDYESWTLKIRNIVESRTKCQINFVSKYTESILNGTDPVLKDELIPVTIENDGTVKKADIQNEWYDYETRRWANAVILNDESIGYGNGEVIPEKAIESYFVWIPRYKYKIFDMGNYIELTSIENKPQVIDIVFGIETTSDTNESCKTPMESGESGKCSVGKYMTHPAFLAFQSTGMWVGKFETGYKEATSKEEALQNVNNPDQIQIKPNLYSWRGMQVSNAYLSSYAYNQNLNSHMMKNTEWGAVAYLQHSQYGSGTSVRINNNSDYKTGYAAVHQPTTGYIGTSISCTTTPSACNEYGTSNEVTSPWNTDVGYLASTTGNISGIYDMSGGAFEYMMSTMKSKNGDICIGVDEIYHSGFQGHYCNEDSILLNGIPFPKDSRYYDIYLYGLITSYQRRILGDATGEMGPFHLKKYGTQTKRIGSWYEQESSMSFNESHWVRRSGAYYYGVLSGNFMFSCEYGRINSDTSFRIVLTV